MQARFLTSISELSEEQWSALWSTDYPFISHAFLSVLEDSGCTTVKTGWLPCHLILEEHNTLLAAMPLYQKEHSYGEYVFDWGWADAYHRAGLNYYPKLLCAIPFTPATGPRVGFSAGLTSQDKNSCMEIMEAAIQKRLGEIGGSGFHCLFPSSENRALFDAGNTVERQGCQFHWFNDGYKNFDEFLASFSSRKRKNIKRERQKVGEQNIVHQMRLAKMLPEQDWQLFYQLYQNTYLKRSGHSGYLSEQFFQEMAAQLPDQVLLCSAHESSLENPMVAAALYFKDSTTLYGRYWGAKTEMDGVHFETCYYQGIEYAIDQGLKRFDPGAQGEHKIQRGFTPIKTCSFHFIKHPQFFEAVKGFVAEEKQHNQQYCQEARTLLPFKEGEKTIDDSVLLNN
ncbi:GNAT family N-acetyltransferase [Teredinibacter haidensis]|uniref:GNAT family N-acetyltransferase n=1 Tax=Teredinibacter haidensis TaxID=2731755 RepID=UPI0009490BF1|nr:GNAT family N-acetyltransferase [Teredinibacter haidensis]